MEYPKYNGFQIPSEKNSKNENSPTNVVGLLKKEAGSNLLSHSSVAAVPSATSGLTSEFGKGSGVARLFITASKSDDMCNRNI